MIDARFDAEHNRGLLYKARFIWPCPRVPVIWHRTSPCVLSGGEHPFLD